MTNLFTSLLKAVAVKTPIPFSFNQSGVRFISNNKKDLLRILSFTTQLPHDSFILAQNKLDKNFFSRGYFKIFLIHRDILLRLSTNKDLLPFQWFHNYLDPHRMILFIFS